MILWSFDKSISCICDTLLKIFWIIFIQSVEEQTLLAIINKKTCLVDQPHPAKVSYVIVPYRALYIPEIPISYSMVGFKIQNYVSFNQEYSVFCYKTTSLWFHNCTKFLKFLMYQNHHSQTVVKGTLLGPVSPI